VTAPTDISPPHWQETDEKKHRRIATRLTYGPKSLSHTELFHMLTEALPGWRRALDGNAVVGADQR
jgi:hypothetical protein